MYLTCGLCLLHIVPGASGPQCPYSQTLTSLPTASGIGGLWKETSLPHWDQMASKVLSISDILGLATPEKEKGCFFVSRKGHFPGGGRKTVKCSDNSPKAASGYIMGQAGVNV